MPEPAKSSISAVGWFEFLMMNNPVRAAIQRLVEARRLLKMGGPVPGSGKALEIGCGRGVGAKLILDMFAASNVDGVDLDPRMIARAEVLVDNRVIWAIAVASVEARIAHNWNTAATDVTSGPHTITVRVFDASENGSSASVDVTVGN